MQYEIDKQLEQPAGHLTHLEFCKKYPTGQGIFKQFPFLSRTKLFLHFIQLLFISHYEHHSL